MPLLIVESPSKCSKIESLLKTDYKHVKVIATCGHFRDVESINDNDFQIQYKPINSKMQTMRKFITKDEHIILATDNDREGEAIAWAICDQFDLDVTTTPRIIFNEITKDALLQAMETPTVVNMKRVDAQTCRVICDRWIGYTFTPHLWNNFRDLKNVSAGRCQTPTLHIVKERENEIKNGKHEFQFYTEGFFLKPFDCLFQVKKHVKNVEKIQEGLENSKVKDCYRYSKKQVKKSSRNASPPFCTSTLQQYCSTTFNWSPTHTMKIAQTLYEQGKITYHRTESTSISAEFSQKIKDWIECTYGLEYYGGVIRKAKGAHECIRPTMIDKSNITLQGDLKRMFEAIWSRTIQSQMAACKLDCITVFIEGPFLFEKTFEKILFPGFRILQSETQKVKVDFLESLDINSIIDFKHIESKEQIAKKTFHYSEGQLVKILDDKKIGRPSTFSSFVQKIQDREYVSRKNFNGAPYQIRVLRLENGEISTKSREESISEKQKIIMEDKGEQICNFLYEKYEKFFNYEYTAIMEQNLDKVESGELEKKKFLECLKEDLKDFKPIKNSNGTSSNNSLLRKINQEIEIRKGKNGWSDYICLMEKGKRRFISLKNFRHDYKTCEEDLIYEFIQLN